MAGKSEKRLGGGGDFGGVQARYPDDRREIEFDEMIALAKRFMSFLMPCFY